MVFVCVSHPFSSLSLSVASYSHPFLFLSVSVFFLPVFHNYVKPHKVETCLIERICASSRLFFFYVFVSYPFSLFVLASPYTRTVLSLTCLLSFSVSFFFDAVFHKHETRSLYTTNMHSSITWTPKSQSASKEIGRRRRETVARRLHTHFPRLA